MSDYREQILCEKQISQSQRKVSYMHCRELVRIKEALCSASVPKYKIGYLSRLNRRHFPHRRNSMPHTRIQLRVHEPRDGLLMHRLQNERLRNRSQNRLLLSLEGNDGLEYTLRINDMSSQAVACGDVRCDLQGRYAKRAQCDRSYGDTINVRRKGRAKINGLFNASEERRRG